MPAIFLIIYTFSCACITTFILAFTLKMTNRIPDIIFLYHKLMFFSIPDGPFVTCWQFFLNHSHKVRTSIHIVSLRSNTFFSFYITNTQGCSYRNKVSLYMGYETDCLFSRHMTFTTFRAWKSKLFFFFLQEVEIIFGGDLYLISGPSRNGYLWHIHRY